MRSAAVRYQLRPMHAGDIPQVMVIERQSFPSMWSQTAYRRELRNRLARYLVIAEAPREVSPPAGQVEAASPERGAGRGFWAGVRRLLGGRPGPPPTDELILGFVGLWLMVGEGHIVTLAVRESHRRQGIGERLLIAALDTAIREGQEVVTLEVRSSNLAAQALYEKYGFSHAGVRRRYYADEREDAVIMTTPLLHSDEYRTLLVERRDAYRRRWGEAEA